MKDASVGDKLDQYELTELLARSGMASIFKARDSESGQAVALKIPHLQYESDVVFFERFKREEQIGQRLSHPYIIKVLKPIGKSRMYMAMEFVEGKSLRALLEGRKGRSMPMAEALTIVTRLTEAVVYLHENGIVHRDIKPENVILTGNGLKLLDFGIAMDESARRLTWSGLSSTIGTPDYMAPEQVNGRRGDERTDIYALGTLLYELSTGHLPFEGPNAHAMMNAKASEDPRPPRYHASDIDPALETIILKAIERVPRDRYEKAAELLKDLRDPGSVPLLDPEARAQRRRGLRLPRRVVLPLTIALVLLGLGTLVWLSGRGQGPAPLPATAPEK